ncbi:MAG: HD domain-containing protein [Candidatus Omnitrophica bacterium]|nr:HD domain-containing protein [Candidatus Omnitrophota bacterium]
MKRVRRILSSFRTRVTVVLILSLLFVMCLSNFLIYRFSLRTQFNQLRERLMMIAQTAALNIDGDLLMQVPLSKEGVETDAYKTIAQQLKRIKDANMRISYIYTMVKTSEPGYLQFVVDPEPVTRQADKRLLTSYPGDRYDARPFPEMVKALKEASADKALGRDAWGVILSGYAPIRNSAGTPVALLGVDMLAEDVYAAQREVNRRALVVLAIGILVSIGFGLLLSHSITERIEKLVEATRHIAADDLSYKVRLDGHDEIAELADSFNSMATSLAESRTKLHDYFYRVVQSLVRILEAKDTYTQGHSERVSEYAQKIAQAMGFTQEKVELVRRAAELHDIGKLVIHENILNKKGKLTEEEWKIIREHPVVGEEILKPVLVESEMLTIIRSHHERCDGMGYPDKLKGDQINIFSQIIAVADSFDAMVSSRAYRPPLSKEEAIGELQRNCGTQFNTQVVNAFLRVV